MPQDVSAQQISHDLSEDAIALQPWSMESDAERLMNDLFGDIDRVLETGGSLPTEPIRPESVTLQPLKIPPIDLPAALLPLQPTIIQASLAETTASEVEETLAPLPPVELLEAPVAPPVTLEPRSVTVKPSPSHALDKVLLVAIAASVLVPVGLWVSSHGGLDTQFAQLRQRFEAKPQVDPGVITAADADFSNYMQRSLQLIEQQSQTAQTPTPGEVAVAPNAATGSNVNPAATVLERVYIPVYQPPPATTSRSLPSPPTATSSPAQITPVPQATPGEALTAVPVIPAPVTPIPAPSAVASLPTNAHALVGVLEMGDRSFALFEVDGVTRRFGIGETIGASGWALVDIKNQEAIVRRNGEVRSVYVGQKF